MPNRVLLRGRLRDAIGHAERQGFQAAVCFLDLDRFKAVNDTLGHSVGDALLPEVFARLKRCVRDTATDTVARLGGDEFPLVLPALVDVRATGEAAGDLACCMCAGYGDVLAPVICRFAR